jgi:hypothetical protein
MLKEKPQGKVILPFLAQTTKQQGLSFNFMNANQAIETLRLQRPITHDSVRKAFRNLAKEYHPDKHFTDVARENASAMFVRIKAASDILLEMSEGEINNPRPQVRRPVTRVKRERTYTPPSKPLILNHPLVKEFENIMQLFRLAKKSQVNTFMRKLLVEGKYAPGVFIGNLYERLFERKYAGEEKLGSVAYAVLLALRLLWGAVFMIISFFVMAIIGLIGLIFLFPPITLFSIVYWMYHQMLQPLVKRLNKTIDPGVRKSWLKARRIYLWYRTLPLLPMSVVAYLFIQFCQRGTYYITSIAYILSILFGLLALSIFYEWLHYFKVKLAKHS